MTKYSSGRERREVELFDRRPEGFQTSDCAVRLFIPMEEQVHAE